jgi:Mg2+ and Co2+ transporter CorA
MIQEDLSSIAHRPGLVWGFDLSGETPRLILETDLGAPEAGPPGLKWLHFNLSDQRTLRWLAGAVPERMAAFLAAAHDDQGFVLEDGMLGIVLGDLEHDFGGGELRTRALRLVAGPNLIVTARRHPVRSADLIRQRIEAGAQVAGPVQAVELALDCLLEVFLDTTAELEAKVQDIEDELLRDGSSPDARQFITLRAVMVRLHRAFVALRTMLRRLEDRHEGYGPAAAKAVAKLSPLDSDLQAIQNQLRLLRDELDLQEAQQTNKNVYFLSILTALFMPATLVTGIFGMNTSGLLWTDGHNGSLWATGLAFGSAGLAYLILRLSGFIRR